MNRKGFVFFTLLSLIFLAACGVLEVGVEHAGTSEVTATSALTVITRELTRVATATSAPATATPTVSVPAPTKTPEPTATSTQAPEPTLPVAEGSVLQVAFVREGNVWLWNKDEGTRALTSAGDVSDVRISDDGEIVAFVRGFELWAVNSDGTGERTLIDIEDIASMVERGDPGVRLYQFGWVPGRHVVAFNTRAHMDVGLVLFDDLQWVDANTLERSVLLPRGEGGQFTYSPDGSQIALVRSGTVTLVDADGGNRREAFTYTPPVTRSEFQYYVQPVWAADSKSLRVGVPPADPFAQPPQLSTVWHVHTDGRAARLLATINAQGLDQNAFSPDLGYVAYVEQSGGMSPGSGDGVLLVTDLDSGETVTYHGGVGSVYGWAPDSLRFAFMVRDQHTQAQIGMLGSEPVPAHGDPDVTTIDVRWLDTSRYLYTTITGDAKSLFLSEIGGASTVVATVNVRSLVYDFCLCRKVSSP
jgi:hypothetical protein